MRDQPRMALSGVRSSCDTVARNSSFMRLASSGDLVENGVVDGDGGPPHQVLGGGCDRQAEKGRREPTRAKVTRPSR